MCGSKARGKGKNPGENVRFAEIEGEGPRNAVISTDKTAAVSGEKRIEFYRARSFNAAETFASNGMGK